MNRDELQRESIVRLFQVSNELQTYIDRLLKQYKLTTKQFFIMIVIGSFEHQPRIGEISDRFGTSRQNVKQVLDKLVKTGYVNLHKDENDSRIIRANLTESALDFWGRRGKEDDDSMNTVFSTLSDIELFNLRNSLEKVSKQIKEMGK